MATEPKVRIIWNGKGGELDSRTRPKKARPLPTPCAKCSRETI